MYNNIYGKSIFVNENYNDYLLEFNIKDSINTIKEKLRETFLRLINYIQNKVNNMKDSKIKSMLNSLLGRCRKALTKVKSVESKEEVKELQDEAKDIKEEINNIKEDKSTPTKQEESKPQNKEEDKDDKPKNKPYDSQLEKITDEFKDAVLNVKGDKVKTILKNSLLKDKTFRQFDKYLRYAEYNIYDIDDNYNGEKFPKEYTEDNMNIELSKLVNNFCDERINWLKKCISEVYK